MIKIEEQTEKHKVSGRKQQNFKKAEADYQIYQSRWEKDINDKEAWNKMWFLIQTAVFNNINKKLENIIPKNEIEEKALDVTCSIMAGIIKKREQNKEWKIGKVSSYVYLPCMAIYQKQKQFEDNILDERNFNSESEMTEDINYKYNSNGGYYEQEINR